MNVVKKVEKLKKQVVHENITEKSNGANITKFIAKEKSRQEYDPLLGKAIERVHIETLSHPKNNARQKLFKEILCFLIHRSQLGNDITKFASVPQNSLFSPCKES